MPAPIVFVDIAGPNDEELAKFYNTVFDWPTDQGPIFSPGNPANLDLTIRKDPAEKLIYIGVPDVSDALQRIELAGGKIDVPRFEVPGSVILGLFFDPAGNKMGLIEMDGDTPIVP